MIVDDAQYPAVQNTITANAGRPGPTETSFVRVGAVYPGFKDHNPLSHSFRDREPGRELHGGRFRM